MRFTTWGILFVCMELRAVKPNLNEKGGISRKGKRWNK